jgi:hypothetical protein
MIDYMAKRSVMQQYARIGTLARLNELRAEIADIERAFPGIGGSTRRGPGRPALVAEGEGADTNPAPRRRGRKPMTAAQRKAVGARMKKYWAARHKAAGK